MTGERAPQIEALRHQIQVLQAEIDEEQARLAGSSDVLQGANEEDKTPAAQVTATQSTTATKTSEVSYPSS